MSSSRQRIVPNLWFQGNAAEGAEFYERVFPRTHAVVAGRYPTEGLADFQKEFAGEILTVDVDLDGYRFTLINADSTFRPDPAISFMVNFDASVADAVQHLDDLWRDLADGGTVHMALDEYPFSRRYGWVEDRFGVSWQLVLGDTAGPDRGRIIPSLLFGGPAQNLARPTIERLVGVFDDSEIVTLREFGTPHGPAKADSIAYADFRLDGQWFAAMDSGIEQSASFGYGVSLLIECDDQDEIDRYWSALSHDPEAEVCGWCKDEAGISWQVVPRSMDLLMSRPGAYSRMMQMKKIIIDDF